MQGKKDYQEKLFAHFQLSDRVPQHNFYRRLKDDMVKIRLKLLKSDTKKHEVDETGNVKKRLDIISIKPLNDDELMKWNNKDLEYLTIIEK